MVVHSLASHGRWKQDYFVTSTYSLLSALRVKSLYSCRCLRTSIAALALFVLSLPGYATEAEESKDWYKIEFVLFEHLNSDTHVLRYEDVKYQPLQHNQYSYLIDSDKPLSAFHLTPVAMQERETATAIERLERATATRVLMHGAWQQAIAEDEALPPLKIDLNFDSPSPFSIRGSLGVRRSRYMHVDLDIYKTQFRALPYADIKDWFFEADDTAWPPSWLTQPATFESAMFSRVGESDIAFSTIHFRQSRRIRDAEWHYIDHPALGVLVTIKKIDTPFQFGEAGFDLEADQP